MTINKDLTKQIKALTATEEWEEVYNNFFVPKLNELLQLDKDINILPENSNQFTLDYRDNLLCRQIAGRFLKDIFFTVNRCKKLSTNPSPKRCN